MRVFIVSCLVAAAFAAPFNVALDGEWAAYKTSYNKRYISIEDESLR